MPKVSVIIPIYNVEAYIEESLKSVCEQNFNDFEIIIVNDGTKDASMEIIDEILKTYDGAYKIINQNNLGLPAARNAGIREAEGEFICFIDSDDIISKNFLKNQYEYIIENKLDVCFCDFEETKIENRYGINKKTYKNEVIEIKDLLKGALIRKYKIHCCTLLIRRAFLENNSLYFNEELKYGEDVQFMWRLFPILTQIGHINSKDYKYLIRSNSLMTNQNINKVLILQKEMNRILSKLKKVYPEYINIFKYLQPRIEFGCIHSFTKQVQNYNDYLDMINKLNYKKIVKQLLRFPDIKIRILVSILYINPKIFYKIFKKI
ncbi:hypothetical protein JCM1393_07090 [Clostridium carnis]